MSQQIEQADIMDIAIHQTHHQIADFESIFKYLEDIIAEKQTAQLHVFPELFLTGYPLQDLCLQKPFIIQYEKLLAQIEKWAKKSLKDKCFLVGGLKYELGEESLPLNITNVIYEITSNGIKPIYTKQLLPNYDIFDEQKYFTAGNESKVWEFNDKKIGLLICEDMWASTFYHKDPVDALFQEVKHIDQNLDLIINLSASPFNINKDSKRLERSQYISRLNSCPYIYVNRVGGEDEILFDGHSFVCDGNNSLLTAKYFAADTLSFELGKESYDFSGSVENEKEATWESLFSSRINTDGKELPLLKSWTDQQCQTVLDALMFGFQEYAGKCGFKNFTIALSGGMDSALVLTIMRLALKEGQYLEAVYMPSVHSATLSYDLSLDLCKKQDIPFTSLPIKYLHSVTKNLFGQTFDQPFEGLTDENVQSRLRGMLLYTRSNQINSMVVNTSNKSELAVGYSTQYGDSVGAISLLGDLYKSEVYRLAEYINKHFDNMIPEDILTREPSAELRPDQMDSQSLPPYDRLDAMLEGILSYRHTKKDLINSGFDPIEVEKVYNLYRRTEYKRYQFCPIIKISSKSFGFGYRVPLSKKSEFYID